MTPSARSRLRTTLVAYGFLAPALLVLGIFFFYPMARAFLWSAYEVSAMNPEASRFVGLENFQRLWEDQDFWLALKNSLTYLLVVPVLIVLSFLLALLVEPNIPGVGFFRAAYYVPVVTTMVVVALLWKYLFRTDDGLVNELLQGIGLLPLDQGVRWLVEPRLALFTVMSVTVWKGLGYYMVLFLVALKAVPKELMEAARIDGARAPQVLWHVKVPQCWPTVALCAVVSSISAIQVFEEVFIITQARAKTATLATEIYSVGFENILAGDLGYGCAMGVVLFLLILGFSAVAIRLLERVYTP